jgi:aspartate/methionine/tyrosine aminotransferase
MANAPSLTELQAAAPQLEARFAALVAERMSLDMTRGKPCSEQLDLSLDMATILGPQDYKSAGGVDCRNYGGLDGLPEAKKLFADFFEVLPAEVIVGGNSSLATMHDTVARAVSHGVPGGKGPWGREAPVKFLCPSPGYDRHFTVCEHFGIEMIVVENGPSGLDIAHVERLVAADESIKGIWLVPKYGNPTGLTLSAEVVERLARMPTKAADFRIFWDNAYAVHHLGTEQDALVEILGACKAAGNPDRPFIFGSTSKISLAGAGLSAFAASATNVAWMMNHLQKQTIGPDKMNQLRHLRFFRDMAGVHAHMAKHAQILAPKFSAVDRVLTAHLGGKGVAEWTSPRGGYFVSIDTLPGCAKRVVAMAAEAGVKFTEAGATFPYGKDPEDRNIRIAPSLPSLPEIEKAMEVLAVCIQRVSVSKLG